MHPHIIGCDNLRGQTEQPFKSPQGRASHMQEHRNWLSALILTFNLPGLHIPSDLQFFA